MVLIEPAHKPPEPATSEPATSSRRPFPLAGLLRMHGNDIARIQRVVDPILAAWLFALFDNNSLAIRDKLIMPLWAWVLLLSALLLPKAGIYRSYRERHLFSLARRLTSQWGLVLAGLLMLTYTTKTTGNLSRLNTSTWAILTLAILLLEHVGLRQLLRWHRSRGGNTRTILYWGPRAAALALQRQLQDNAWMGWTLEAWFSPEAISSEDQPPQLPPCGGGLDAMRGWLATRRVDRIVFSHSPMDSLDMETLIELFGDTCMQVIYAPDWALSGMRFQTGTIGDILTIDLWGSEPSLIDRQIKRSFDLVLSCLGVLLISPVLVLIALAVALSSPGPILFAQDRYGLDGRRFRIVKFRTMRVTEAGDQPGLAQARSNDPRITPLGRFLRRWSLDELPQLFNVIRGDMSLVGPRPHAVEHNEQYRRLIPGYMQRHAYKPGMTGLAQVEGWRGETSLLSDMTHRVEADLRYQREWSLKLDIKILIMTLLRLRSPRAY